jgi:YD repeat-containing protein
VTDPLGRVVTINWVNNRPDTITPWTGETWTLSYTGGHRSAVRVQVTNPVTGVTNTEKVGFEYDGAGTVSEVDNGVTSDQLRAGWLLTYANDPTGLRRVATVKATPGLAATTPTPWTFEYSGPYRGTTATYACVTDPLGSPGVACGGAHQTKVDFNTAGLPLGITGPRDQTGYFPVTTLIWDSNNNLVCRRTPAANAAALIQWNPATPTACQDDARSTKYDYRNQSPFQLLTERHPVGSSGGTGSREILTYDYDRDQGGAQFNGLWAETFTNKDLRGVPKDSLVWGDMDESWGTGAPANLPSDNFSIRWTGLLDISDFTSAKKIAFRLTTADEGASLVLSNSVLLDCLGTTQPSGTYNCGTNQDVKSLLQPGLRPIVIEYADPGQQASFKLEWDQGTGTWQTIPPHRLQTNIGLLTKETVSSGSTGTLESSYTFPTDWAKSRQLPSEMAVKDLTNPSDVRRTTFTYGQYGQVLTTTTAAGTAFAATTTNEYTFQAPTSCLTKITDPTGAVTNFVCNEAGDVETITQEVRAVGLQPAQDRITDTTYDDLGRVVKVLVPSGGYTQTDYDKAGRPITVTRNLGAGAGHDPTAVTNYTYDDAGHVLTETLPRVLNPATGQLANPTITHTWDWLDDETRTVDVRGKTWNYEYDALRRLIKTTSPSNLVTQTEYKLSTGSVYAHQVTTWTPPGTSGGVPTVSAMDVNGRVTSTKLGTLTASSSTYDPLGRLTRSTDPAGISTDFTYNGFGQTRTMTEFATAGASAATTTYAFDAAGRLDFVDGPRTDITNDITRYDYDLAGRLTSAKQEGITPPGAGSPGVTTTYAYDDAGELVRTSQPLTSSLTQVRDFTFDTSGRMASAADTRGTTTYTYGAGDQLEQVGDPRGITLRFEYDNLGRQTRRYRSGSPAIDDQTFTYDQASNLLSAKVQATGTTITAEYDNDGRIFKVYQAASQPTTTYTYNATTGRLTSIADPAGTTAMAAYDANGLLTQIDDPMSSINVIYTYDGAGRVTRRTDGGKLCTERFYEVGTGRIDRQAVKGGGTACSGSAIATFDLSYDKASNVASRVQSVGTGTGANPFNGTYTYAYDAADRLTQVTGGPAAFGGRTYAYDGGGNRTSVQVGGGSAVTTSYDAAGLPVSSSDGTSYSHDAVGNLTAIDRTGTANDWFFTYGSWSTTTKAAKTPTGSDVAFTLDALDRVLSRVAGSSTATYTYSGIGEILAKAQVGSTTTTYVHTPGGPLAQKSGNTTRYYVRDLHGDLVAFSDNKAVLKGTAAYDPFGPGAVGLRRDGNGPRTGGAAVPGRPDRCGDRTGRHGCQALRAGARAVQLGRPAVR